MQSARRASRASPEGDDFLDGPDVIRDARMTIEWLLRDLDAACGAAGGRQIGGAGIAAVGRAQTGQGYRGLIPGVGTAVLETARGRVAVARPRSRTAGAPRRWRARRRGGRRVSRARAPGRRRRRRRAGRRRHRPGMAHARGPAWPRVSTSNRGASPFVKAPRSEAVVDSPSCNTRVCASAIHERLRGARDHPSLK